MKKLIGLVLSIALVFSSASVSLTAEAASVKKISMKVGDTKKLKIWKKNNTCKVSGKTYVKVTKAGKVKAMKKGNASITVKHGNKWKKFKISVKDVYFSVDYSQITKATIYNLTTGETVDLDAEHLQVVKDVLQEKNLVKDLTIASKSKKVGSGRYGIHLLNAAGEELYNIAIHGDYVHVFHGDVYRIKKALDLRGIQALF